MHRNFRGMVCGNSVTGCTLDTGHRTGAAGRAVGFVGLSGDRPGGSGTRNTGVRTAWAADAEDMCV